MRARALASRVGSEELVCVQEDGLGVTGGLYDVLVDDALPPGSLISVRVHGRAAPGLLDARGAAARGA